MKTKTICLAFFLLMGSLYTAHAQQRFNAGIRLGANFCQIDGDQMSGYNMGGLVAGVFVSYPFNSRWEGQFEMLFSQKGSQRVIDSIPQPGLWDLLRINYLEVPLMVNCKLTPRFKLSGGLGLGYMISNHFEGMSNYIRDNVDFITKLEFNGTLGAQYYISPRFSIFGRFTYSLLGINKPQSGIPGYISSTAFYFYDSGMANNVISFGLYYSFLKNKFPDKPVKKNQR